jgi:lysophospholipase L1-like esterase
MFSSLSSPFSLRPLFRLVALFVAASLVHATEEQRVVEPVGAIPPPAMNPELPTLWVAGDSTAANGGPNSTGWGMLLPSFFDTTKMNVVNRARGGRSSRTFITEGLWDELMGNVKPGDVVLIQFGHNDGGAINEEPPPKPGEKPRPVRARGSLPGLGEETREIDNVLTKKHEVVHTFGWYLRKMISDTKAKGATPVLLSLTVREIWKDGQIERGSGRYREWISETARMQDVAYIDLTTSIADAYQALGPEKVKTFFPKDYVHTGPEGADLNASLVVAGLKTLRGDAFAGLFSEKSAKVPAAPESIVRNGSDLLYFGKRTPLRLPQPANAALPSLILIGDSTVRNGRGDGAGGQWGWGEPLSEHFDLKRINVVNRAVGGLSSRTYLTRGYWETTLALVKAGDFVVMQFGHNDGSPVNDTSRARGTLKGTGAESEDIENLLNQRHEVVHTYGWYLRKYISDTRAKGATPIVCSPVPRKKWEGGKIMRTPESYPHWAEQVARETGVPFIDLHGRVAAKYDQLGEEKVNPLFADEHTHTSRAGAELNAATLLEGLKQLPGNPFAPFLK